MNPLLFLTLLVFLILAFLLIARFCAINSILEKKEIEAEQNHFRDIGAD